MFIFYVSDFFVCYSFFIFIVMASRRGQILRGAESGFPAKGVSGSPPTGLITAWSKYLRKALI